MPRNKIILPVNPAVRATAYFSVLIFARTDFFHTRRAFFSRLHAAEHLFFRFFRPVYLYCFILRFSLFANRFLLLCSISRDRPTLIAKAVSLINFLTPRFTRLSFVLSARFFRSFNYYKVICSICGALLCSYKTCFSYTLQHKIRIRRNTERKIAECFIFFPWFVGKK